MKFNHWAFLMAVLAGWVWVTPLGAEAAGVDDERLEAEQKAIDQASAKQPDSAKVSLLSQQFGVDSAKIESLRQSGQGWGALTNELALAQELQKKDPATYPTVNAALDKVQTLRSEGKGLGLIAKDLGIKLGPVVSAARHTRNELRRQTRTESRTQRMERSGRPPSSPRFERPPHPEKPPHSERPGQ